MFSHTCLCCSHTLLRHIRSHQVYWFCPHCYQAMPESLEPYSHLNASQLFELSVVKSYKVGSSQREKVQPVPELCHVA
jgi:ribosomal protein L37AE/L43A